MIMISRKRLGSALFNVVTALLISVVVLEACIQLRKYLSKQTTIVHTTKVHDMLALPGASFCPGFKKVDDEELVWPTWSFSEISLAFMAESASGQHNNYSEHFTPIENGSKIWERLTFALEEVLLHVVHREDLTLVEKYSPVEILREDSDKCLHFKEHNTLTGKCFTLLSSCYLLKNNIIEIKLNMSAVPKMPLYLHHPRAVLGLNDNFWSSPVTMERIGREEIADLALRKKITVMSREGESVSEDEYFDCLGRQVTTKVLETVREKDPSSLCHFPTLEGLLGKVANITQVLAPCRTVQDYVHSYHAFYPMLYSFYAPVDCPAPADRQLYLFSRMDQPFTILSGGQSLVYLYFETTDVLVEEEKNLMDLSALVPAIGGSVGIFLGWSFHDLARLLKRN